MHSRCKDLVGHEEDHLAVVLTAGMGFSKVGLRLLNEIVFGLTLNRLAARAVQMCFSHMSTIAYR